MGANAQQQGSGTVDAVVIGRNEGARLIDCLRSLCGQVRRVVYVDSGSTDGSTEAASIAGAEVVALDMGLPFTAARARNAGLAALADDADFVFFVDGDCIVQPGWVDGARAFLLGRPDVAVVCGRRREANPEASIYNLICDREWNTPTGETLACGGDAVMRHSALRQVQGYRADLIAGEEPELCQRLRRAGWVIWRLDAEMTLHDAAMTRFSQWWRRSLRAGHAFAEGASLHGKGPDRHWVAQTRRALFWGVGVPVLAVALGLWHPAGFVVLALWPLQWLRLTLRQLPHDPPARAARLAGFLLLGKLPEALGALGYYGGRITGRRRGLIEYKST